MGKDTQTTVFEADLFNDIFSCISNSLLALEVHFGLDGAHEKVIGPDAQDDQFFRKTRTWETLSQGIDYALNGIEPPDGESMSVPGNLRDILHLASTDSRQPSPNWWMVVDMADGRFALDEGDPVSLPKVALLAKVDVRTVRNAISAGELVALKPEEHSLLSKEIQLDNASVRRWLQSRRGFKPTVQRSLDGITLDQVQTPAQFGAFMTEQSKRLAESQQSAAPASTASFAASTTAPPVLEAGVFDLPLSVAFPLADLYQLERKAFIQCVMRVFFAEELAAL